MAQTKERLDNRFLEMFKLSEQREQGTELRKLSRKNRLSVKKIELLPRIKERF